MTETWPASVWGGAVARYAPVRASRRLDLPLRLVDEFPASRLVHLYNDNVLVMLVEGDLTDARPYESMATYTADFYRWFEDEFDYLVVYSNLTWVASREAYRNADLSYIGIYLSVMNDTLGFGESPGLFRNPAAAPHDDY